MKKTLAICLLLCTLYLSSCGLFVKNLDTTDIEKYGIYDDCVGEDATDFFPQLDKNIMSNFRYSYNTNCFADCAHEIYLEFTIENEDEFTKFIEAKQNDILQKKEGAAIQKFKYDENYSEIVIKDKITTRRDRNNDLVIDSAMIYKVIYNEQDHTVIFVSLYVMDYWEFENSTYIERFHIDPNTLPPR